MSEFTSEREEFFAREEYRAWVEANDVALEEDMLTEAELSAAEEASAGPSEVSWQADVEARLRELEAAVASLFEAHRRPSRN